MNLKLDHGNPKTLKFGNPKTLKLDHGNPHALMNYAKF